jgi:hypothetical protein
VVASRNQSDYKNYHRDLPFLMNLAVTVDEVEVALELSKYLANPDERMDWCLLTPFFCNTVNEMLGYKRYVTNDELTSSILSHLRSIIRDSLESKPMNVAQLKQTFRTFEKMSAAQEHCDVEDFISVSTEYYDVITSCKPEDTKPFLELIASEAEPLFALQSLLAWSTDHKSGADFLPLLHSSLTRSATLREKKELSPALLRVGNARSSNFEERKEEVLGSGKEGNGHLWRLMMSGDLHIDK